MNFTGNMFFNNHNQNPNQNLKKNIILPPNQSEGLRSSSSYGNRFKPTSTPKIYNANSFGVKVQDLSLKFFKSPVGNNTRYTSTQSHRINDFVRKFVDILIF